jgi:hypothetical protein
MWYYVPFIFFPPWPRVVISLLNYKQISLCIKPHMVAYRRNGSEHWSLYALYRVWSSNHQAHRTERNSRRILYYRWWQISELQGHCLKIEMNCMEKKTALVILSNSSADNEFIVRNSRRWHNTQTIGQCLWRSQGYSWVVSQAQGHQTSLLLSIHLLGPRSRPCSSGFKHRLCLVWLPCLFCVNRHLACSPVPW